MKKHFLIFFVLLLPCLGFCSGSIKINGFWGVKWQLSKGQVINAFSTKPVHFIKAQNDILYYTGTFAQKNADIRLKFDQNRFYSAGVIFENQSGVAVTKLYKGLLEDLTQKYGEPAENIALYLTDDIITFDACDKALIENKGELYSAWQFEDGNFIKLAVLKDQTDGKTSDLRCCLVYHYAPIEKEIRRRKIRTYLDDL